MSPYDADPWLDAWLPQLRASARNSQVLELGCDAGIDTRWLVEHGFSVVASDISKEALGLCAQVASPAQMVLHDLREPLPFSDGTFGAVIASLCLHYFDWSTTVAAVAEIRRCLGTTGLLLCRVNSVRDTFHGAGEGRELEPRLYQQDARYASTKRFFNAEDLARLFPSSHWGVLSRREVTIHRYAEPKVAWELALARTS
ncbi:MAG TPA: class I SAM-dependent methyltransferase [Ramlibacter sp.]|nr:class I SAM-dependent methyltransferase [Ramlibacter sp.]